MPDRDPFDVGEMIHRVRWMRKIDVDPIPGGDGQPIPDLEPMGTYWAKITPVATSPVVNSTEYTPLRTSRVRLRWSPQLAPIRAEDRLIFRGRTLVVSAAWRDDEQSTWIMLETKEQPGPAPGAP